ncbi:hypothetical protein ACFQ0B_66970 [Nonomuraea thailandensis]
MNGEGAGCTGTYHLVVDDGSPYCACGIDVWRSRAGRICPEDARRKTRG